MTVGELIKELQKLPSDAIILKSTYTDDRPVVRIEKRSPTVYVRRYYSSQGKELEFYGII